MVVLAVLLAAVQSTVLELPEDWGEGVSWCTYATCNPSIPAYLPWDHGRSGIQRTCGQNAPPFNFTFVDTFDITIWSASEGADVDDSERVNRQAGVAEPMELLVLTMDSTVVRTVQVAVTPQRNRQLIELPAPQTQPLWVRLQAAPGTGVRSHYIFYEMILYQRATPLPAGNLACINRGAALCNEVGYEHSSACAPQAPSPPAAPPPLPSQPTCGDDCVCDCCLPGQCPQLTRYTFRAGSADRCQSRFCQSRFYSCPDDGAHNANAQLSVAYADTPPCGNSPPPSLPAPPESPPGIPPGGGLEGSIVVYYTLAIAAASGLAACVCLLACALLWVRKREKEGEPVWTSLDRVVAPAPQEATPRCVGAGDRTLPFRGAMPERPINPEAPSLSTRSQGTNLIPASSSGHSTELSAQGGRPRVV